MKCFQGNNDLLQKKNTMFNNSPTRFPNHFVIDDEEDEQEISVIAPPSNQSSCTEKRVMSPTIFRFKFEDQTIEALHYFAKVHQYDDRHAFKEAWEKWCDENMDIIRTETNRLTSLEYDGDVVDKMFKSVRYYYRKKSDMKSVTQKRKTYVGVTSTLIDAMNQHIMVNITNKKFKPSNGFDEFCMEQRTILQEEVNSLFQSGVQDPDDIKEKIKKTYKNRYFMIIKSFTSNNTNSV